MMMMAVTLMMMLVMMLMLMSVLMMMMTMTMSVDMMVEMVVVVMSVIVSLTAAEMTMIPEVETEAASKEAEAATIASVTPAQSLPRHPELALEPKISVPDWFPA